MSDFKSQNDQAWEQLFDKYQILNEIDAAYEGVQRLVKLDCWFEKRMSRKREMKQKNDLRLPFNRIIGTNRRLL